MSIPPRMNALGPLRSHPVQLVTFLYIDDKAEACEGWTVCPAEPSVGHRSPRHFLDCTSANTSCTKQQIRSTEGSPVLAGTITDFGTHSQAQTWPVILQPPVSTGVVCTVDMYRKLDAKPPFPVSLKQNFCPCPTVVHTEQEWHISAF